MRLAVALLFAGGSLAWAQPMSPTAFVQSIRVNTHLAFPGTAYFGNPQNVLTGLQYLGINTVRDQAPGYLSLDPTSQANIDTLASDGVQFDVLMLGDGPVNITGNLASIASFSKNYPGSVIAVEGPNEINAWPITYENVTNLITAGIDVTKAVSTDVKSNSTLKNVPIYALTLSGGFSNVTTDAKQLGNLSSYVTYGNAHIYATDNLWSGTAQYYLPIFSEDTPGKTTVMTETGYPTISGIVDELSAAKYNLNLLFENALNGIPATYLFELADADSSVSDTDSDVPERAVRPVSRSTARRCSNVAAGKVTVPDSGRPTSSRSRARRTSHATGSTPSRRRSLSSVSVTPPTSPTPFTFAQRGAVPARPTAMASPAPRRHRPAGQAGRCQARAPPGSSPTRARWS